MSNEFFVAEFTGAYDQRAPRLGRLVEVRAEGDSVRVVIKGENPISNSLGFVVLSDETHSRLLWESVLRAAVMSAADFRIVKGAAF